MFLSKRTIRATLTGCIVIFLGACSPTYYPPILHTPLFTDQGQTDINLSMSGSSFNLGGSHSFSKNALGGVNLNAYVVRETAVWGGVGSTGYQMDLFGGFYNKFGNNGVVEVLAAYAMGSVESRDLTGTFYRPYVQPSVGFSNEDFQGAISIRYTGFLADEEITGFDINGDPIRSLNQIRQSFLETALTARYGNENVKASLQFLFSLPAHAEFTVEYVPAVFNLGIAVRLYQKGAIN